MDGGSVPGRAPSRFSTPWNCSSSNPSVGAFPFTLQWAEQGCDKARFAAWSPGMTNKGVWLEQFTQSWASWEPPGSHPHPGLAMLHSRDTQGVCPASSETDRHTSDPQLCPADLLQNSSSMQTIQLWKGMLPLKFPWDWLKMQPPSRNLHIFIYLSAGGSTAQGGANHALCKSHRAAEPGHSQGGW